MSDIRRLFAKHGPRLLSATVAEELATMVDRPWPEYHGGKPITQRQIANLLKPFRPPGGSRTVRTGDESGKGYKLEEFEGAFQRYLPADESSDPSHRHSAQESMASDQSDPSQVRGRVTDQSARKPLSDKVSDGVTDDKPAAQDGDGETF